MKLGNSQRDPLYPRELVFIIGILRPERGICTKHLTQSSSAGFGVAMR